MIEHIVNWFKELLQVGSKEAESAPNADSEVQKVDLSTLSPALSEQFEASALRFAHQLRPKLLLINICGPWHERKTGECWIAVGGGYTDYGKSHPDAPTWPLKQAYFEQHKAVEIALHRLGERGIRGYFAASGDHNLSAFYFIIKHGDAEIAAIRELAKEDFGVVDEPECRQWDEKFDLYLNQNWFRDDVEREKWRREFPLVEWETETGPKS